MTNEKLLKKLHEMKLESNNEFVGQVRVDEKKYLDLMETIKEEIRKESIPESTSKKQYTAIKRFLNQKHLQMRPVLTRAYQDKENDRQIFTDSYTLYIFNGKSIIPQLPDIDEGMNYPKIDKLIEPCKNIFVGRKKIKVEELKKIIKTTTEETFDLDLDNGKKVRLSTKYAKWFVDIMGFKNKDVIEFRHDIPNDEYTIRQLYVSYGDREGIILPCRVN